jgi:hypothetical protein
MLWLFALRAIHRPVTKEIFMPSRSRLTATLGSILGSVVHAAAITALVFGNLAFAAAAGAAETPAEPAPPAAGFSAAELDELVAPIALYPDELLAVALPAATYPLQIVQAARFLEKRKSEPDLEPDEDWDESILALLNYPEVIDLMNQDLDWTWKLGEAVADQQGDVLDAIQVFRAKVDGAGNLESNDKVTVVKETQENQQIIVIESSSPEVIYVPTYEPSTVVVQQTTPYPYYYSSPYPYYYRPAAAFWTGMFVGAAIGWGLSWGWRGWGGSSIDVNRNVNVNVNRPTRPSTPNRPNRPGGPGGRPGVGTHDKWKADKGRGKQSGARPGRDSASRPGGSGSRPGAGIGTRPGGGAGARPGGGGSKPGAGARPQTRPAQTGKAAGTRGSSGRNLTSPSTSQRASKGSSLGSYNKGSKTRASSYRGSASRGSAGRGGSRGGSRGGGGRRR